MCFAFENTEHRITCGHALNNEECPDCMKKRLRVEPEPVDVRGWVNAAIVFASGIVVGFCVGFVLFN